MSNPKVFEFAKEIGLTPLALMDKIKEWHLPVKNHMAELEPEVLEQIKSKLAGPANDSNEAKPKKTATRKPAVKKVELSGPTIVTSKSVKKDAEAKAAIKHDVEEKHSVVVSAKTPVIRRKTKEMEVAVEEKAAVPAQAQAQVQVQVQVQAQILEQRVSPD